jgi:TonB family protein
MYKIFTFFLVFIGLQVNSQPTLKGGIESFIQTNMSYPAFSYQNCIQGTIDISFKLNQQGEVYSSRVSKGLGVDLDQEALRLIRLSSGKWKVPADYDTTYVLIAPVNFSISSADCNGIGQQEMNNAISVYQTNAGLTDAIANFYQQKSEGKSSPAEEKKVIALKKELGYDDEYFQKRIAAGQKKLKQKDRQGACEDFLFVRNMGSNLADALLAQYCN